METIMSATPKSRVTNSLAQKKSRIEKIKALNDAFRKDPEPSNVFISLEVVRLGEKKVEELLAKLKTYSAFTAKTDHDGDYSTGVIQLGPHKIDWGIFYMDLDEEEDSPDPSNPSVTTRILNLDFA